MDHIDGIDKAAVRQTYFGMLNAAGEQSAMDAAVARAMLMAPQLKRNAAVLYVLSAIAEPEEMAR